MAARGKKKLKDSDSDVYIPKEAGSNAVTRFVLRPWILLLLVIGTGAYIAATRGLSWLPDLAHRREYRLKAESIHCTELPAWVPQTFLRQVVREADLPDELSLLDDSLVDHVRQAFQKSPWVDRVVSVRKDFARGVTVALEYRKPVATVVIGENQYPIDKNAVLLPPANLALETSVLPVIRGARSAPPAGAGDHWNDKAVQGAAQIAERIEPAWKKLDLESIELPEPAQAGAAPDEIYSLLAVGGSRIIWGRPPGSDHPGELTPEQKIGRLEEYFARQHGFGGNEGPYEIDIRHWQEITRRPLPEREGARQ
jgi:hypothetical protein